MIKILTNLKASYVFNFLAICIVVVSLFIYSEFNKTSKSITDRYKSENLEYVENFTQNLKKSILKHTKEEIYESLKNKPELIDTLEEYLQVFVTSRYKYIYLLDKESIESNNYRFLLDGSKNIEDKSEFGEVYVPLEGEKFNSTYKTKRSLYFVHKEIESLWVTYINPVVINGKVEALIVVDFSMKDYEIISNSLKEFDNNFQNIIWIFFVIFLSISWFSYIDNNREKDKNIAYMLLKEKSEELEDESLKVKNLNVTLEERVKEELEKNRKKDQQIIEQSRLAQMGEMLSMIAHQWRQPLSAISSTSSGLELKASLGMIDEETVINESQNISRYSQHLSSTIDDFRNFYKSNKNKKKTTYSELIQNVLNIIEVSIVNKNIELVTILKSDKIFNTYSNEIKQVLLNLIKNAEDTLLERDVDNPQITIKSDGNKLTISDNGGGVPEDIINKIFDPYFSTKLEKNGTGLGLYISKTIIEEHCSGKLSVANDENGAVFTVLLNSEKD